MSKNNNKIKAVIFDFGNVICSYSHEPFYQSLSKYVSHNPSFFRSHLRNLIEDYEIGKIDTATFIKTIKYRFNVYISKNKFIDIYSKVGELNMDVLKIAERLSKKYKLGLVTDIGQIEYLRNIYHKKIFKNFSVIVTSFEVILKIYYRSWM
jgi:FMN phosphatase YigB (HAD superfamily)